jgi:hypothetical protein
MSKRDHRKGMLPFRFVALPIEVIQSAEWQKLPHSARALAIDLMCQYTGKNNGRLCPGFPVMQKHGWKSKETLARAKKALLKCSFVIQTRLGHAPSTAEWIGFTWWKLDYDKSMDINPRCFPYLNFVSVERLDPNEGRVKPAVREVRKAD